MSTEVYDPKKVQGKKPTDVETKLLAETLQKVETGASISYAELSETAGENVQDSRGRGHLRTARGIVMREHGAVFATIRGEGLQRLDSAGISALASSTIRSLHRRARRARTLHAQANLDDLTEDERIVWTAGAAHLNALKSISAAKTEAIIIQAVSDKAGKLPGLEETLRLFSRDAI